MGIVDFQIVLIKKKKKTNKKETVIINILCTLIFKELYSTYNFLGGMLYPFLELSHFSLGEKQVHTVLVASQSQSTS